MELTVEVTDRCNCNCIHCSSNASPAGESFLPVATVVDAIQEVEATKVILSGGEPFLHPELEELIDTVRGQVESIAINTCGYFKYGDVPSNVEKVNEFYVSFYSFNNEKITRFQGSTDVEFSSQFKDNSPYFKQRLWDPSNIIFPVPLVHYLRIYHGVESCWFNVIFFDELQTIDIGWECYHSRTPFHAIKFIKHGRGRLVKPPLLQRQREVAFFLLDQFDPSKVPDRVPVFLQREYDPFSLWLEMERQRDGCKCNYELPSGSVATTIEIPGMTIKSTLELLHSKSKISHSLLEGRCRASEKRTLLPDGKLIGCVAGKGVDERFDVEKVCCK